MNDRIKLAEAMGWEHTYDKSPEGMFMTPEDGWWRMPNNGGWSVTLDFDPLNNANDDYAVLEWMRSRPDLVEANNKRFSIAFHLSACFDYHIGDFARAALEVIEDGR